MSFQKYLKQNDDSHIANVENLSNEIKNIAKKYFKNPIVFFRKGVLSDNLYFIDLCLISEKEDQAHSYYENDPLNVGMLLEIYSDKVTVEYSSSSLFIKPKVGSYYAFERVSIPTRKYKVDSEQKLLKKFNDYFKKVSDVVNENKDNLSLSKEIIEKYVN